MNMVRTARRGKTTRSVAARSWWAAGTVSADVALVALALMGLAWLHWFGG